MQGGTGEGCRAWQRRGKYTDRPDMPPLEEATEERVRHVSIF